MTDRVPRRFDLEAVLSEALRALAVLDAEAIEGLADYLARDRGSLELPSSAAEWTRLRSRQWVLGHLLEGTGRRLEMLRRVCCPPGQLGGYGGRRGIAPDRPLRFVSPGSGAAQESFQSQVAAGRSAN